MLTAITPAVLADALSRGAFCHFDRGCMNRPYFEAYRSKPDTSLYMPTYSVSMTGLGAKRGCFGGAESEMTGDQRVVF